MRGSPLPPFRQPHRGGIERAGRGLIAACLMVLTLDAATTSVLAQQESGGREIIDRTPTHRALVVAGTAASGFGTGFALGWRDGVANDARNALTRGDAAAMLEANRAWHAAGYVTKPLLVLDLGGAIYVGGVLEPDALEAALLAASWGASLGLGFHLGHNAQQGQAWTYFGEVDVSDQWAKEVGPRLVAVMAVTGTATLLWMTYRALR